MPSAAHLRSDLLPADPQRLPSLISGRRDPDLRSQALRSEALRSQIETTLASRFAGALTPAPRTIREVATTGIAEIDALLVGGLPVGAISELVGPECSGRMSAALSFVAQRTGEGRVCAWVDVNDGFDPESAAANGVGLSQLLWVRCSESRAVQRSTSGTLAGSAQPRSGAVSVRARMEPGLERKLEPKTVTRIQHGCAGQHPRSEVKGMEAAIEKLLRPDPPSNKYGFFTPVAPNRKLETGPQNGAQRVGHEEAASFSGRNENQHDPNQRNSNQPRPDNRPLGAVLRHEQVSTDRQSKPGRSKYIVEHNASDCETFCPRCAEAAHKPRPDSSRLDTPRPDQNLMEPSAAAFNAPRLYRAKNAKPWTRLDQAIRATDLLLQAGGFSSIVLDLGSIGPEHALRIPLATWFRFRQAADHSRTSLLVLAQTSCAKSSAAMVLRFEPMAALGSTVMEGVRLEAGSSRQRFAPTASIIPTAGSTARKPPKATWQSAMYSSLGERPEVSNAESLPPRIWKEAR